MKTEPQNIYKIFCRLIPKENGKMQILFGKGFELTTT